jgi:Xaa-Pro dipeptidase
MSEMRSMNAIEKYIDWAFPKEEYLGRLAKLRSALEEKKLDGTIFHNPEEIYYFSGHNSIGYYSYQHLLIGTDPSIFAFLTRVGETAIASATCIADEIFFWRDMEDPIKIGAEIIKAKGLGAARLGIQESAWFLRPSDYQRMQTLLPEVTFVDISNLGPDLRLVKSPAEIEYVRRAAAVADVGMQAGLATFSDGVREVEIGAAVYNAMLLAGGDYPALPLMLQSGPRSAFLHSFPTERRLRPGDVLNMEVVGCYKRYNANVLRSGVIGKPSSRVRDVYEVMREAVETCTDAVRPGLPAAELDQISHRITERYRKYRLHRTGYSLEAGYPPATMGSMSLIIGDEHVLEPGMVFSIEPNITLYDEGWGLFLGNCVLVTPNGREVLVKTSLDLALA